MLTIIYCRKSRGTQEELNNQIDICRNYCNSKNYEVSEIFSEIRSSQDFERVQYIALKNYIKENTNVRIIVTHADRLNRNLIQQAKLNELLLKTSSYIEVVGSGIIKLDTPEQQMMSNIINSFNQYNYQLIRHKMITGLHNFQERGGTAGSTPSGFVRKDKYTYVLDPSKADIVRQIFVDIANGVSTKEVADKLEQINFRSNNNKKLNTREVRNIVRNEAYYKNNPQIVSKELWLEANSQLRSLSNRGKRTYALSSKIVCSKCGNIMVIGVKNDRPQPVLSKGMSKTCKCMSHRYDYIESIVKSDCLAYIESKLDGLYQKLTDDKAVLAEHQKELDTVQTEIDTNKEKLTRLNKLFLLGNVTEQELQEYSSEYKNNIALLEEKQKRLESYSLYRVVQELQDKIVALEELQESANMSSLVKLVDYVSYYKDQNGLSVVTVFRE